MRVMFGDVTRADPVADLRDRGLAASSVVAAVRDPDDQRVACPPPGSVHAHVGYVHPGMDLDLQHALAAAARSRGVTASQGDQLAAVREQLADFEAEQPPDLRAARRRVADAGTDTAELRERVARLGGRIEERRAAGDPTAELEDRLRDVAADLAEAETERVAAEQALRRAREVAREARDERERRLALEDRERNLTRAVRVELSTAVYDAFCEALGGVPGEAAPGDAPAAFDGETTAAALAVARIADLDAPVVVDGLGRAAAESIGGSALVL